ncbi:MAG: hypothetical protein C0424_01560 [Sphingobacteriaceae bacterium]|nr:hypothetical protein [Sphingobacteriaceae bacterium]
MTPEAYISSGILELYVMGSLESEEMAEVEAMAQRHPEVLAAINDIRDTLGEFGALHAQSPPPALRSKVLESIAAVAAEELPVVPMISKAEISVKYARVAIAASIALFLLSALTAVNFYLRWQEAATLANSLLAEKTQLAAERDVLQARASESSELLALIAQPDFRLVNLKGTEKHPEASALVAWNPGSAEVYLWVNDLPQPAADEQYQLWAIVDGQPQDAGVFDLGQGSLKMKDFGKAQAFAITLERKGGSPTPNLEQLHVIGTL